MLVLLLITVIGIGPQLRDGWPISTPLKPPLVYTGGAKAFDFDNDGIKEVVVISGHDSLPSLLHVIRLDGTYYTGTPVIIADSPFVAFQGVSIGKLDPSSQTRLVFGSYNAAFGDVPSGEIYEYTPEGTFAWNEPYTLYSASPLLFPMTLHDLDNDGSLEILCHVNVTVLSGDGTIWDNWETLPYSSLTRLIAGDINADSILEIITSYNLTPDTVTISVIDTGGIPLPNWPQNLGSSTAYVFSPVIADINGDSTPEIIIAGSSPVGPADTAVLHVFDPDGTYFPGFPLILPGEDFHAPPAVADVDSDGNPEIVVDGVNRILIINSDASYSTIPSDLVFIANEPAIVDVDGDGQLEIVRGTNYMMDGYGTWHAYKSDGSEPEGWPIHVSGIAIGTPLIDDLDSDGFLEMVVLSYRLYNQIPDTLEDSLFIYIFDLPAPFDSALVPWGQYAHDLWNSGIYGFNPPVSVAEKGAISTPTGAYSLTYTHGRPILTLTVPHPQKFSLSLYDLAGRLLWSESLSLSRGTFVLPLYTPPARGVYFLQVNHQVFKLWVP